MYTEAALGPCLFECVPYNLCSYDAMHKRISNVLGVIGKIADVKPIMAFDIYREIMRQWPYNTDKFYDSNGKTIYTHDLLVAFSDLYISKEKYSCAPIANTFCCQTSSVHNKWLGFVNSWQRKSIHPKGILPKDTCSLSQIATIPILKTEKEWYDIAFPWLRVTDYKLPISGFKYDAPDNYKTNNPKQKIKIKGNMFWGFRDAKNHIWIWDSTHAKGHWDVQCSSHHGDYFRVFVDDKGHGTKEEE